MDVRKAYVMEEEQSHDLEELVDRVLALANGDARKAVRGLILGQHTIVAEKDAQISTGYVRGRLH
ncbi:MAG: hypothetical protein INR68_18875 [Methylobacterium mesophilicum]|nr:hypothetical protein [Methylobacterium mesophilicum]